MDSRKASDPVGASDSGCAIPGKLSGFLDRDEGASAPTSILLIPSGSSDASVRVSPAPSTFSSACSASGKSIPGVIVAKAGSSIPIVSKNYSDSSVLDGVPPSARLLCSSSKHSSLPSSALVYPVHSSHPDLSAGSLTAPGVYSGAPSSSDTTLQLPSSNFKLNAQNFPPLLSSIESSAVPLIVPPRHSPLSHPLSGLPAEATDVKSIPRPSWASLVQDSQAKLLLSYVKPVSSSAVDGRLRVKLPSEVAEKGASVWKNTLVGFFLDKLPYSFVQASALRLWANHGLSEVLSNGNGFFFFKFSEIAGLNVVLEGGPWHIGGRPIFIKLWTPGMNLSKEGCKRVPIWAHFYNVPLELWTDDGLSYIASAVGKPLHADPITASFKRLNYARICIEINIDDSLPNAIDIDLDDGSSLEIQIEYNWIPKKCSVCSEFGHLSKNCKRVSRRVWVPKTSIPPVISSSSGDWKTVTDHGRVKMNKTSPASKVQHLLPACVRSHGVISASGLSCSTNAFESLHVEDDADAPNEDCSSNLVPSAGILGRSPEVVPSLVGPLSASTADSVTAIECLPASIVSGTSPPSSSPSSTPLLARKLSMIDEVEMKLGRKKKMDKKLGAGVRDPNGSGFGDPFAADDPIGSGVGDPFASDDPIGEGVGDPLDADDPIGTGADDPNAFDDPIVPMASSSVSLVGDSALSPPASTSPLLARKIIMVDEFEKKLGRKKKDKRKSGGCGSSGSSRGNPSLFSK